MPYVNLKKELAGKNINFTTVAELIEVHPNTFINKLNGKTPFNIDEVFKIKKCLFPNLDLDYLFQRDNEN